MIHNLKINGMHCASCEKIVKTELENISGVKLLSLSSKTGDAKVDAPLSLLAKIKSSIKKLGYEVV